jgi:anti-sigma factor ChrR (cupin superfamily)
MSDKAARDAQNNAMYKDIYMNVAAMPWIPHPVIPGTHFKVLRTSGETGVWTVLFKNARGSSVPRHEHLGAGEYLILSVKAEVRGGVEKGGITASAGDYGYEPSGVIHDCTYFPEDTVYFFTNHGPIKFIDDDNNILAVVDWLTVRALEAQAVAQLATPVAAE